MNATISTLEKICIRCIAIAVVAVTAISLLTVVWAMLL